MCAVLDFVVIELDYAIIANFLYKLERVARLSIEHAIKISMFDRGFVRLV